MARSLIVPTFGALVLWIACDGLLAAPLTLTLERTEGEYALGRPIPIRLTITNDSPAELRIPLWASSQEWTITIDDAKPSVATSDSVPANDDAARGWDVLRPGERKERLVDVGDLAYFVTPRAGHWRFSMSITYPKHPDPGVWSGRLVSNVVEFVVRER
jgi:hypothetical protein